MKKHSEADDRIVEIGDTIILNDLSKKKKLKRLIISASNKEVPININPVNPKYDKYKTVSNHLTNPEKEIKEGTPMGNNTINKKIGYKFTCCNYEYQIIDIIKKNENE